MAKTPATAQWSEAATSAVSAVRGRWVQQPDGRYALLTSGTAGAEWVEDAVTGRRKLDPSATSGIVLRAVGGGRITL